MTHERSIARTAGLIYLVTLVTGMFSLVYAPSQLLVPRDVHATIDKISAHQTLFRFDIASSMIMQVAFLTLPLVLYRLLRSVNQPVAVLMVALAVVSVPLGLNSLTHQLDLLSLLNHAALMQALTPVALQLAVTQMLDGHANGLQITSLFWGLWLLPFGYLVWRSGFLPKTLGALLTLGGMGYLIDVFGSLLYPHYAEAFFAPYVMLPASLGEIGMILWLLIVGVRIPHAAPASPAHLKKN